MIAYQLQDKAHGPLTPAMSVLESPLGLCPQMQTLANRSKTYICCTSFDTVQYMYTLHIYIWILFIYNG